MNADRMDASASEPNRLLDEKKNAVALGCAVAARRLAARVGRGDALRAGIEQSVNGGERHDAADATASSPRRGRLAEWSEVGGAPQRRRRQSRRSARTVCGLRDGAARRGLRRRARAPRKSLLDRRPAGGHGGVRLARCVDAGAERLCRQGAARSRRRGAAHDRRMQGRTSRRATTSRTHGRTHIGGEHFSRLRAVENRYDADGLFVVHHGVGSEDWSADGLHPPRVIGARRVSAHAARNLL